MVKMANNKPQTGANPGNNSGSNSSKNQGGNGSKTPGAKQPAAQPSTQPQQPPQQKQFNLEDLIKEETGFFAKNDKAMKEVGKDLFVGYAKIITQERNGNVNYKKAAVELSDAVHTSYLKRFLGVDISSVKDDTKKSNYLAMAAAMTGIDSLSLEKSFLKSTDGASLDIFETYSSTLNKSLAQLNQRATLYRIKKKIQGKEDEVANKLVATLPKQHQSKVLDLYKMDPTRLTQDLLMEVVKKYSDTQQYEEKLKSLLNP